MKLNPSYKIILIAIIILSNAFSLWAQAAPAAQSELAR